MIRSYEISYKIYEMQSTLQWKVTNLLVSLITKLNPHKDDGLATLLHETAGLYQRRPQDGWTCPTDWECWKH
jgi:hypothetical protein